MRAAGKLCRDDGTPLISDEVETAAWSHRIDVRLNIGTFEPDTSPRRKTLSGGLRPPARGAIGLTGASIHQEDVQPDGPLCRALNNASDSQ